MDDIVYSFLGSAVAQLIVPFLGLQPSIGGLLLGWGLSYVFVRWSGD